MPLFSIRAALRALIAASLLYPITVFSASSPLDLKQQFKNPPAQDRPMVRWWWFGTAVEKSEILHELEQMKADNIGGAELAFVYPEVVDDPAKNLKNLPFLSPGMLDCVHYAQEEARKLGLRIDVTLGSGWPYGGPATTLDEAASRLRVAEVPIPARASAIAPPKLAEGETILSASIVDARAGSGPTDWDAASAKSLVPGGTSVAPSTTGRVALFFIASHTGQVVKRAAVGAEGWVLDPFSRQAVATHLQSVGEPLVQAFGATPPYAVFSDSLEAYGADWTPSLPAEFKRRRGYDLLPHLPELIAGGTAAAEKVRHDWGVTLTELVNENYLTQINSWADARHTKFRSQTYGEPAVNFSSQHLVALPEGEGSRWRQFSTLRWATSANHVYGNQVTSGETFTWLHSPAFRATPLDMKAEADIDFITGENQLIFHGWPYSAPQVGEPGWSLYAAAVFNDHNPWHPVMPDVNRYIQRISFLLRQGEPANQIALLLPTDDGWASFAPGKVTITGEMSRLITPRLMFTILSAGYNIDFIDADAINSVGFGSHSILIVPPTDRIPANTLAKISAWVSAGGKAICVGRAPSIDPEGETNVEITNLSHQLFDAAKSTFVADESQLTAALHQAATADLQLTSNQQDVGFIRRKLPMADVYFVANTANHPVKTQAIFGTNYHQGEQWDPDSTASAPTPSAAVDLNLAAYESRIFVFSAGASISSQPSASGELQVADLTPDWQVHFTSANRTVMEPKLSDWTADPASKFYSGEAVYSREFTLPIKPTTATYLQVDGGASLPVPPTAETPRPSSSGVPNPRITLPGPGMQTYYDPPIREAAVVFVNGQRAGSLWHPPYRLEVTPYLHAGRNRIEIHVYNTAINAWAALPPYDYGPLIAKYGDRFQMQDLNQVQPVASGLLGTVHLFSETK
jgi:alpha-L-rhamnosidase